MTEDIFPFEGFELANLYDSVCWQCQQPTSQRTRNRVTELCTRCSHYLLNTVVRNKKRARVKGNEATLTSAQWAEILRTSRGYCTYCHTFTGYKNLVLEHMIPVGKGGGTTSANCVPACQKCNWEKMASGKGGAK